jgi:hypothetical protein
VSPSVDQVTAITYQNVPFQRYGRLWSKRKVAVGSESISSKVVSIRDSRTFSTARQTCDAVGARVWRMEYVRCMIAMYRWMICCDSICWYSSLQAGVVERRVFVVVELRADVALRNCLCGTRVRMRRVSSKGSGRRSVWRLDLRRVEVWVDCVWQGDLNRETWLK